MNIAVLAGGYSHERDVSLTSASLISNALIDEGHKICLCDVYLGIDLDGKDEIFTNTKTQIFFCITIIGIPFGKQCFKLAALALIPFGARVNG